MLPKQLTLLLSLLSFTAIGFAQRERTTTQPVTTVTSETIARSPFSRNINQIITNLPIVSYSNTKPDNSDDHTSTIRLRGFEYNRFIVDGVGVGLKLDLSSLHQETGTDYTSTEWMAWANVIYGRSFNDFNIYGKLSAGIGKDKTKYNSTSTTSDLSAYKFEVGVPIHLFNDGGNYFTPFLDYRHEREKDGAATFTDNSFGIGFRFQNYSMCSEYSCDCHHGRSLSNGAYNAGRNFIGFPSMGHFDFGTSKYKFNNTENENDFSGGMLKMEYGHYIIPNLAIGAGFGWNTQTSENGNIKYTNSQLMFTPMLTGNLPTKNCWNNLFMQVGYGFGYEKNTSGNNEQKYNLTEMCANLGFNFFTGKHLAFTPRFGWEWESSKETDTDIKYKTSGPVFDFGTKLQF